VVDPPLPPLPELPELPPLPVGGLPPVPVPPSGCAPATHFASMHTRPLAQSAVRVHVSPSPLGVEPGLVSSLHPATTAVPRKEDTARQIKIDRVIRASSVRASYRSRESLLSD
jgi:hypothetical protein